MLCWASATASSSLLLLADLWSLPCQGFPLEEVLSPEARAEWKRWKREQPSKGEKGEGQHDTIGLIVRDAEGNIAAGKSSDGVDRGHQTRHTTKTVR